MILDGNDPSAIATAARALRSGALLGLPTETVYGLAADASSDAAVAQIFAAKGRPSDHPLIVHVADAAGIAHFASDVPAFAQKLVDAFWPGPLTLILPRRPGVATAATGGQDSVGLRCPAHPVAHAVLQACSATGDGPELGGPPVWGLAAPSANRFGRVSPTTAQHVQDELGADLLVLDGGGWQGRGDDERRLFYVAMTRARDTLTLCERLDGRHPFIRGMDGLTLRTRAPAPPPGDPLDTRIWQADPSHIVLSWPGRFAPSGSLPSSSSSRRRPRSSVCLKRVSSSFRVSSISGWARPSSG